MTMKYIYISYKLLGSPPNLSPPHPPQDSITNLFQHATTSQLQPPEATSEGLNSQTFLGENIPRSNVFR